MGLDVGWGKGVILWKSGLSYSTLKWQRSVKMCFLKIWCVPTSCGVCQVGSLRSGGGVGSLPDGFFGWRGTPLPALWCRTVVTDVYWLWVEVCFLPTFARNEHLWWRGEVFHFSNSMWEWTLLSKCTGILADEPFVFWCLIFLLL